MTAQQIADKYTIHERTVWKIGKRHALRNDLAWPINRQSVDDHQEKTDYQSFREDINSLKRANKIIRLMTIHDLHIPNQDSKALNVALKVGSDLGIHVVNDLSDAFEYETIGRWPTNDKARVEDKFNRVIKSYEDTRKEINSALKDPVTFSLMGNHDYRIFDFLARQAPQFQETIEALFIEKIRSTGTRWLGKKTSCVEIGDLIWFHGKYANANTAKTNMEKVGIGHSVTLSGHLHRLQSLYKTIKRNGKPKIMQSFVTGCLCKLEPVYSNSGMIEDWQHGFALLEWDTQRNSIYVQNVLIDEHYGVTLGNKTYKAD